MTDRPVRCWLLLEKSDETRVSQGIDRYNDQTGEIYSYDDLVPGHARMSAGDVVILRREDQILGIGWISDIAKSATNKVHRRCVKCKSTDVRLRSTKMPPWKCGACKAEFREPTETTSLVTAYTAKIRGFHAFAAPPSVIAVKQCGALRDTTRSQHSMIELDSARVSRLLECDPAVSLNARYLEAGARRKPRQGIGLTSAQRRAVELRSMEVTRAWYEREGWSVIDTSKANPYDFVIVNDTKRRFVEVKGTTGVGDQILLTRGEVEHVRKHRNACILVVVHGISLSLDGDTWIGTGGKPIIHEPWQLDDAQLTPTQFRCKLTTDARRLTPA